MITTTHIGRCTTITGPKLEPADISAMLAAHRETRDDPAEQAAVGEWMEQRLRADLEAGNDAD